MSITTDFKFSGIMIADLTPRESFIGNIPVTLSILSYLYFNDSSKYDELVNNLKCYFVNVDTYGERVDSIRISGIDCRVSESGEGTFSLEISVNNSLNVSFNKVGTYYLLLTTKVGENIIEILSTEGISIKSKLEVNTNIEVTKEIDILNLNVNVSSLKPISSYSTPPTVQIQFFTENKYYNTISIIDDGVSINYVSATMTSEEYVYVNPNILLTKIGKLNNLFVRVIVSLDLSDKLIFDKTINVDVIYDTFDNGDKKGFSIGKYCDEEKTIFECDFPAQFNSSISGKGIIDYIYPIGSYYNTDNENFNPNIEWNGTKWELLNDGRFLLGSSPDYPVITDGTSNIGGQEKNKLTSANIPKISVNTAGANKTLTGSIVNMAAQSASIGVTGGGICKPSKDGVAYGLHGSYRAEATYDTITIDATHIHNVVIGNQTPSLVENMPPFRVVNIWHRIG